MKKSVGEDKVKNYNEQVEDLTEDKAAEVYVISKEKFFFLF